MAIPTIFGNTGEPSLANYSYSDIANGLGVSNFYLCRPRIDATWYNILTPNSYYSDTNTLLTSTATYDFDLDVFNSPRTIRGTAYLAISMGLNGAGNCYITAKIQKVSGGTVTDCSSAIKSRTYTTAGGCTQLLVPILLTQTGFKKGDNLRLNLAVTNGSATDLEIGTDPKGRDGGFIKIANGVTTASFLSVPFRIDL